MLVAMLPLASALLYIMPSDDPFSDEDWQGGHIGQSAGTKSFVCLVIAAVMVAATSGFAKGLVAATATPEFLDHMGSFTTFFIFCGAALICFRMLPMHPCSSGSARVVANVPSNAPRHLLR